RTRSVRLFSTSGMSLLIKLCAFIVFTVVLFGRRLAKAWREHRHRVDLTSLIPGDEGIPVFGHLFEFRNSHIALSTTVPSLARRLRALTGGRILKLWLLNVFAFFPLDGEMAHHILHSHERRRVRCIRAVGRTRTHIQRGQEVASSSQDARSGLHALPPRAVHTED
ncbi:hypothetical protein PENTCL1PPCAC_5993, partial [Pristionchus entomophagus]